MKRRGRMDEVRGAQRKRLGGGEKGKTAAVF